MRIKKSISPIVRKYWVASVFIAFALILVFKYFLIANPASDQFLLTYKFTTGDSYDWMANGVRLFESTDITFRNPGLPLIIKLLNQLSLINLLPLINQFVFWLFLYFAYKLASHLGKSKLIGMIIALGLFLNFSLQSFVNYILADMYAVTLITGSVYYFIKSSYRKAFLLLGFSSLFQNFAFFLVPVFFFFYFKNKKKFQLKEFPAKYAKEFVILLAILLNINFLWFFYKLVLFRNPLFSRIEQFSLLSPNLESIGFYLVSSVSLFGLAIFLSPVLIEHYRKSRLTNKTVFVLISLTITFVFWILLYKWSDKRFLLYFLPYFVIFTAILFRILIKKQLLLIACAVLIFYPGTIKIGSFFEASEVPVTNFVSIDFAEERKLYGIAAVIYMKDPVIEYDDERIRNIPMPFLADLIERSEKLKYSPNAQYSKALTAVESCYPDRLTSDCIGDARASTVNSILLIRYNTPYKN